MSRQETKDLLKEWRMFLKEATPNPEIKPTRVKKARNVHVFSVLDVLLVMDMPIIGNNSFYLSFLNDAGIEQAITRKLIRTATKEFSGYKITKQNDILNGNVPDSQGYVVGTLNVANPTSENEEGEEVAKKYLEAGYMENLILKGDDKAIYFFKMLTGLDETKFQREKKGALAQQNKLEEAVDDIKELARKAREELKTILIPAAARKYDSELSLITVSGKATEKKINDILDQARKDATNDPKLAAPKKQSALTTQTMSAAKVTKPEAEKQQPQLPAAPGFREALVEKAKPFIREIKGDPEQAVEEMLNSYKNVIIKSMLKLPLRRVNLEGRITIINEKNGAHKEDLRDYITRTAIKSETGGKESKVIVHSRDKKVDEYIKLFEGELKGDVVSNFEYLVDKDVQTEARTKKLIRRKMTNKEMEERVFMEVKNLIGKITNS